MSDNTNLLYNGNFSKGTSTWSGSGLTVSGGVATLTGDIVSSTLIPVANGRRYRLTFDVKFNTIASGSNFYIALRPYDANKSLIAINTTNKPWSGTDTTLAAALKNGDTTVSLTSGNGWTTDTYSRIGICDRLAWGYNRCSYSQKWTTKSGNTLTLPSAWAGGSWPAGTKVAEFRDGSVYCYPWSSNSANLSTSWKTISVEFYGGDNLRWSCKYFCFSTLGSTHNYSLRNIRIECISDYQECHIIEDTATPQFLKTGVVCGRTFSNVGFDVRYIRDTTNGNTANGNNHWNEIEVFNDVGENIAWGKTVTVNGVIYANSVATDGTVSSQYIDPGTGTRTMTLDLGFVEHINRIKIWHYYPDGRTYYNNVTEVSADGTNWITVYSGQKPETSAGNEIILTPDKMSVFKDGKIQINDIIEW